MTDQWDTCIFKELVGGGERVECTAEADLSIPHSWQ